MAKKEIKNVAAEVRERMDAMIAHRNAELDRFTKLQNEFKKKAAEASAAMETASEAEDNAAYFEAKTARDEARAAAEMYAGRAAKTIKQRPVTEQESDETIDRLLAYETGLSDAFKEEARKLIDQLTTLIEDNYQKTGEAEEVILQWTKEIHPNFRSDITTYYDEQTGQHTNRSKVPVPVHKEIAGCDAAVSLKKIIEEKVSHILKKKDAV